MSLDTVVHISGKSEALSGRPLTLARDQLEIWLMFQPTSLRETIEFFALGGARDSLPESIRIKPLARVNGLSGYEYRVSDDTYGEFGFAPLRWGGFVTHKILVDPTGRQERWEVYTSDGKLMSAGSTLYMDVLYVETIEMHPGCPILSHLYNYLTHEYDQARFGQSKPQQIALVEAILRQVPCPAPHRDPAVTGIWAKMIQGERDTVLAWDERQRVIESQLADRAKLISTKLRAHHRTGTLSALLSSGVIWAGDWVNRMTRVRMRPVNNITGFTYKYTIGLALWFVQTVRGNIGYSVALALYGPFTFYFITQPLNPHAMWAVGKVRSVYLSVTETSQAALAVVGVKTATDATSGGGSATPAPTTTSDGKQAAPQAKLYTEIAAPMDPNAHHGMPLSIDYKDVDRQSWGDRMSNFKNMQIGYEEGMQFAARMGRLEQMELQLNFSMIVDSTWEETERYLDEINRLKAKKISPELKQFLDEEITRTVRLEMYVWDKLLRYILDHPYVVMDQSKEQVYRDYYMGRSILLLKDMANKLRTRDKELGRPADAKYLETVANAFEKTRVQGGNLFDRLAKNSKLFAQPDPTDGTALRAYMKRQWEILYLIQNKAQEAANSGLQMYTWSVRNMVWLLQSLYSAKNRELRLLFDSPGKPKAEISREIRDQIEPLYEQLFHMMNLEFASIRPEMSQRLANDIDWRQRKIAIDTVNASLKDRERLLVPMLKE